MKEYRYYLSSGVGSSIRIKLSMIELAPTSQAASLAASGTSKNAAAEAAAFDSQGLDQLSGSSSELRNSSISEIFITGQIVSDGLPMHPMVIR